MKSSGEHVVRRRLADGSVKEYRYARSKAPRTARIAPGSLGALIQDYKASPEWGALRANTRDQYTRYLRTLEILHDIPAANVRKRDILRLRNALATKSGNGAAQAFVRVAQSLFTWACESDLLESSPATKIKPLPKGELRAWSAAEADFAERHLPEELRRVVVLARHTGQRRGDLCAMTWKDYDGRRIRVRQEKTDVQLSVPAPQALRRELDVWRPDDSKGTILTTKRGLPWEPQHLSMMLPRWLLRIDMPNPDGMNMHGLRKLAAASLAEAGCSVHEIAAITGHKTLSMVQHYTKSADQEGLADAAIERLETRVGKRPVKRRK